MADTSQPFREIEALLAKAVRHFEEMNLLTFAIKYGSVLYIDSKATVARHEKGVPYHERNGRQRRHRREALAGATWRQAPRPISVKGFISQAQSHSKILKGARVIRGLDAARCKSYVEVLVAGYC